MRCEARTLDDIWAMGANDAEDDRGFATAARVSEINLALYRTFAQPAVRAMANPMLSEWIRRFHPLRAQYEFFSDANPYGPARGARGTNARGAQVRAKRQSLYRNAGASIEPDRRGARSVAELYRGPGGATFLNVFGSPALQAAVGIDPASPSPLCKAAKNPLHRQLLQMRIAELKARIPEGGMRAAVVRALIYVGLSRRAIDERGFEMARRICQAHGDMPLAEFKALVREQFAILVLDQDAAVAALPSMLPPEAEVRRTALSLVKQVMEARGDMAADEEKKLEEVAKLFGVDADNSPRAARRRKTGSDDGRIRPGSHHEPLANIH